MLHLDEGVRIILDNGSHPCRIPENILKKIPGFLKSLDSKVEESAEERCLIVPNVSQQTFDLALQFAVCKNGETEQAQRRNKSNEITAYLQLGIFASNIDLALGGLRSTFLTKLKNIIVSDRHSLKGLHIRTAFKNLDKGHMIRELFLQASIRPYAEFYDRGYSASEFGADSDTEAPDYEALNPAQRAAYFKNRFCFNWEFENIEEYRLEIFEKWHRVWWSRNVNTKRRGRIIYDETELIDPLTGAKFVV